MLGLSTTDFASLVIAVYAGALSTYLGYRQLLRDRRRIEVFCRPVFEPSPNGRSMEGYVGIRVVNVGHRTIEIIEAWIDLPRGASVQLRSVRSPRWKEIPCLLVDGESVTIRFDEATFGRLVESNGVPERVRVIDNRDNEFSAAVPREVIQFAAEALELERQVERELGTQDDGDDGVPD